MIRLSISLCVFLVAAVLSSPVSKAQGDGAPKDLLHDFLVQETFNSEKHGSVYDGQDVFRFTDGSELEGPKESVFLPQEFQVEAGVAYADEPEPQEQPSLHGRLLSRGRNSNRRYPNRQNSIPAAEEHLVVEEEVAAIPQEEEVAIEVEPQQPKRRPSSRFPLRSRPNPLARGRNRSRPSKKPTTQATEPPPPETEQPVVVEEEVQDQDYLYPDYEDQQPAVTTTPKPRGILARRRNLNRNTNALFEALRKRRKQYGKTTTTTTAKPAPRYEKEVPSAADDSKATGKKSSPSRRFGNSRSNRRRFTPRGRRPAAKSQPEANEAVQDEAAVEEQTTDTRGHRSFRTGYRAS